MRIWFFVEVFLMDISMTSFFNFPRFILETIFFLLSFKENMPKSINTIRYHRSSGRLPLVLCLLLINWARRKHSETKFRKIKKNGHRVSPWEQLYEILEPNSFWFSSYLAHKLLTSFFIVWTIIHIFPHRSIQELWVFSKNPDFSRKFDARSRRPEKIFE